MATACGIRYSEVDENGDVSIILENEDTEYIYSVLHELFFEQENVTLMLDLYDYDNQARQMFIEDRLLFFPATLGVIGHADVRGMSSNYMVIPMPLMDDAQDEYYNMLQDGVAIYGVPTSASPDKYDAIAVMKASASFEAMGARAETSKSMVVPEAMVSMFSNVICFTPSFPAASVALK